MNKDNFDKLDIMIASALCDNKLSDDIELFESLDVTQVVFSRKFEQKKNALTKKERCKPRKVRRYRLLFRIALAIMILLSVAFITIMSVSALRNAVVDVVVEFFNDHIKISYEEYDEDSITSKPIKLNQVKSIRATELKNTKKEVSDNELVNKTIYYKNDRRVCCFYQSPLCENDIYFDNEYENATRVNINGNMAMLIENNKGVSHLTWSDGEYLYVISCYDTDYDIVQLAKSVG